jgi:hypothetical protein
MMFFASPLASKMEGMNPLTRVRPDDDDAWRACEKAFQVC